MLCLLQKNDHSHVVRRSVLGAEIGVYLDNKHKGNIDSINSRYEIRKMDLGILEPGEHELRLVWVRDKKIKMILSL